MKRLLLVSNRLPVTVERRKSVLKLHMSVGGLATGLSSFYKDHHCIWIGWCGLSSNSLKRKTKKSLQETLMLEYSSLPIFLSKKDVRLFYSGFCNRTLWPLYHYFSEYTTYEKDGWESYKHVNRFFSQAVLKIATKDDIIWIHDYHLMLLPGLLREKMPQAQIGFFLHIPFPSYEIFRLLPWRKELLEGVLGSDLIGFHTYDYVRHFISSVRRVLGYEHAFGQISADHRLIKVDAFPMGIDFERYSNAKLDDKWTRDIQRHCDTSGVCKNILSVDRLDYTKGIPQRLEAFDRFLEKYPDYKTKVSLTMIAVPSRTGVVTYMRLKQQIDELVGRINGKHGTANWMPVWYHYRFLPFNHIVALYNQADVALVTPLRDGMNLIAKEYIATKKDCRGVLILSEMAGAMSELAEAIIVNPNNKEEVADAIQEALTLTEKECIARNKIMRNRIQRYNITAWAEDFTNSLTQIKTEQKAIRTKQLTRKNRSFLINRYKKSRSRLIFLDYDGTLVPFADKPEAAKPDNALIHLLQDLIRDSKNEVVLISGRDRKTLDRWFGHLNMGLTAEHGVWIKENRKAWHMVEKISSDWKGEIRPILELYVDRTPGALLEEKSYSLVWHYRQTNPELGQIRVRELKEDLRHLTSNLNLIVLEGNKVLEIKTGGINKGRAALHWLSDHQSNFILSLGDDWTDEDLFEAMPDSAFTVKVGHGVSHARYFVNNYMEVRELLTLLRDGSADKDHTDAGQ